MKTCYKIDQLVWYVDCYVYSRGKRKDPVVWYRPMRARITHVQIEHWSYSKNITVKYGVRFFYNEESKGPQTQNEYIFANRENAWEYAKLTNAIVKLYPLPQDKMIPLTTELIKKQKMVRNREPVEPTVYL